MRVAVIGTGVVGRAIAGRLDELGHDVTVGTRDVAASLARGDDGAFGSWASTHPRVAVATFADAAEGATLVVNATPGDVSLAALGAIGGSGLADRVVLDISNPLDFSGGFPPTLFVSGDDSLGERIQAAFPDARVVKSLNTMTADLMVNPGALAGGDHSVFLSGDDADAKTLVRGVLTELGHTDIVDLGGIETARGTEMYLPLWLRLMGALGTPRFNVKVVRP